VTDDDAVHEFGHAVAARLRRLPWFAERWPGPEDEMEGFTLFHEISRAADDQLKELLRAIPVETREAENNVLTAELPKRRWLAWVILEPDETFYRLTRDDPHTSPTLAKLLAMGWLAIPVEITETVGR
jgi:hypothetical protein